ncbi:astacin-like metalloendopeptidase [Saccoglossus kowalevskii]
MRSPIYSIYTCLCVVLQLNFAASVNFKVGDPSETELSERRHQDAWDTLPDVLRETHLPSERSYGGGSIVNQPAMAQIIGENKVLNDLAEDLMFEGDIYLSPLKQNNAVTYETWLWPNGIVPYEIDSAYDSDSVANIEEAISQYHQHTCIQFVQRTTQEDYVYIYPGNGCYSSIGRDGGRQPLSLGYGCTRHPVTTMHELMHAVGFFHEQSRTDRDDYVYILWQNIQEEHKHNFERHEADYINDLGASYDYFSIMHYSHTSFTIDGQSTILPTQDSGVSPEDLGSSLVFTVTDLYKLNRLYNCECGIEHRLSAGSSIEIMSPNHPGNYDDNADCTWTVINRDGGTVRLEFVSFDTEIQYDYVQFGSGSYPNTDAERHDGNALPSVFNSQSETAWITFRSDSSNVMTGFKLSATAIGGGEDECGGSYELGEGSMLEISSPNYPNNYGNNLDCFWKFTHFSGGEIKFRFTNLDTEPRYDYVQFGDGSSLDQNAAKHSGITTPADTTLSGGEAWVLFHSDETATMTGFQLRVEGLGGGK